MATKCSFILFLIVLILFGSTGVWIFVYYPPGWSRTAVLVLERPFTHVEGFEYQASVALNVMSDKQGRGCSPLILLENGRKVGPAHSGQDEVRHKGQGAFYHYENKIYFSSSDNSDPEVNEREYAVQYQQGLPLVLYFVLIFFGYLLFLIGAWPILNKIVPRRWLTGSFIAINILLGILILELSFWIVVEDKLLRSGLAVRRLNAHGLDECPSKFIPANYPGLSTNYMEHHYLNYVLNPDAYYCGIKQFNPVYKIRRTQEIQPREKIQWRALILGGSTTFGEGMPREQDTWPFMLEQLIREKYGPRCEVINGGVGGYTILENFIHYLTLLRYLHPDLVILHTGINDVNARLFGELTSDYSNYRIPWRSESGPLPKAHGKLKRFWWYRYYFLNNVVMRTIDEGIASRVSRKGPPPSEWEKALKRNNSDLYQSHLEALVGFIKSQGTKIAILPQHFAAKSESDRVFMTGVQQHNLVGERIAAKYGLPYGRVLIEPQNFDVDDTIDNCHFNLKGGKKMARLVFLFLEQNSLLPESSTKTNVHFDPTTTSNANAR